MQAKQQRKIKKYEELTFTDDYMFYRVLLNRPDLCKEILELILDKKIRIITYPEAQKTISLTAEGRGIRLDVYVEDDQDTIYNIEMQTSYDSDIPKRSRYYQGMIDLNTISRGDSFRELKKTFIIFICMYDPFRESRCIYHFQNICLDDEKPIYYGDDSYKIVLNPFGRNEGLSDDMKAFLSFLRGDVIEKRNRLVFELGDEVDRVRTHNEWRTEYMLYELKLKDEYAKGREAGREEGLKEGHEEGLKEGREVGRKEERQELLISYVKRLNKYHVSRSDIIKDVMQDYSLSEDEAKSKVIKILENN